MTPKEKANELIEKHNNLCVFNCNLDPKKEMAKKGALICVDEILNTPKMIYCGQGTNDPHYKYWEDVRKEIIKNL